MPDETGAEKGDRTETPLHAYKDDRKSEIDPGDLGTNPDEGRLPEGADEPGSYQRGGHSAEPESADPVDVDPSSEEAGTASGALDDTVTHPDKGDEGLGTRTGGIQGHDE